MHRNERIAAVAALGLILGTVAVQARTVRRVPRLPRATAPALQLGDQVVIGGQLYQVQATLIPVTGTPIPTPLPLPLPVTTIIGIRSGTTGLMVTSAAAGTPLQLEGTGLGTGGRLQLGGRYAATPTSWSDTKILFNAPDPGAQAFSGGWDLYWETAGGFTLKASTGAFTLLPAGQPVPAPTPTPTPLPTGTAPQIRGLTTPDGAPATKLVASAAYIITGDGFGSTTGRLWINALPATVTQWTDTRINALAPANAADGNGLWVSVKRADGPTSSTKVSR